jgi:hypothetical protein
MMVKDAMRLQDGDSCAVGEHLGELDDEWLHELRRGVQMQRPNKNMPVAVYTILGTEAGACEVDSRSIGPASLQWPLFSWVLL